MISFKAYLVEGNKKYYPYKLNRWKKGQKKRSIAMSNSYYLSQKELRKKVAAAKKLAKPVYKKKKTKKR